MRAFIFLAVAFALFVATPTVAQEVEPDKVYGLCLDSTAGCNDYFLTGTSVTGDTYDLTGYMYGCGVSDELGGGTLRVNNGIAYIGLTLSLNVADFAAIGSRNYQIDLSTWAGPFKFFYSYISGGVLAGHGGGNNADLYVCSDPMGVDLVTDPNESVRGG